MGDGKGDGVPWYADGLHFTCDPDCGRCCTSHGDYQYVYLEGDDLDRLAEHLGISAAWFRRRYTTTDDGLRILRIDGPECPFLDGTRCSVYAARPRQCRTFPFWSENLRSPRRWQALSAFCPGIGQGEPVPLLRIREHLADREGE